MWASRLNPNHKMKPTETNSTDSEEVIALRARVKKLEKELQQAKDDRDTAQAEARFATNTARTLNSRLQQNEP